MIVQITDDFDLGKIVYSGQCFRPALLEDGFFRFIHGKNILYIRPLDEGNYEISCSKDDWENVWYDYFDLGTDYSEIRRAIPEHDEFMLRASRLGQGIRILKQAPFEMLISFIISQRKSIPAIKGCVEKICSYYGKEVSTPRESLHLFPDAGDILSRGFDNLSGCSLGYRLAYVTKAIEDVASYVVDLEALYTQTDEELLQSLMSMHGVGIKVASCVALFAYSRGAIAPVDTWIQRVIEEQYNGKSPFPGYGNNSGIYQQYAFYSATHSSLE